MIVIAARSYSDFKSVVGTLRHLDAVFYNTSAQPYGTSLTGVAYAFDYEQGVCVSCMGFASSFSTSDFPSAIAIAGYLAVAERGFFAGNPASYSLEPY